MGASAPTERRSLRGKRGTPLHVDLVGGAGSPGAAQILELVRADWQRIGVAVDTRYVAVGNLFSDDAKQGVLKGGKFDVALFSYGQIRANGIDSDFTKSIARKHANSSLLAKAWRCRARAEIALGRPTSAVVTLQSIDALDGLDRSSSKQVDDLRILAHAQAAAAAFEAAHAAIEEAERRAGAAPSLTDQISIVRTRAMPTAEMAEREEAARFSSILLDLCRTIGDAEGEGNALQVAARIDWWSFDVASVRKHLRAAATIFERIGKPQSRASVANNAGALENHVGLLDDAERLRGKRRRHADRRTCESGRSLRSDRAIRDGEHVVRAGEIAVARPAREAARRAHPQRVRHYTFITRFSSATIMSARSLPAER